MWKFYITFYERVYDRIKIQVNEKYWGESVMDMENVITTVLEKKLIVMDIAVNSKEEAISYLADILYKNNKLISKETYIQDVMQREAHCTTGIGGGIAIPHGKSKGVKETSIAIGKLSKPIEWNALDNQPVKVVFLLAIKEKDEQDLHIKILSHIASRLIEEDAVNALMDAKTPDEIINLLCK